METRLLIGGELVAGEGARLDVENPYTAEAFARVGAASPEQVDSAIAAAATAARPWAATPAVERAELLHELATRLRARTPTSSPSSCRARAGSRASRMPTRSPGPPPPSTTTPRSGATRRDA